MKKPNDHSGDVSHSVEPGSNAADSSHDARPDTPPLYVITLMSSMAPMSLTGPSAPELAGLAVFRSKRRENGRERFRMHLGYFATAELAEEALPLVRDSYPAAFVCVAPQTNMGSLDDTAIARFSVIRPVETDSQEPVRPAAATPTAQADASARPLIAVPRPAEISAPKLPPAPSEAVQDASTQHYAVQLLWSGQAIDPNRIPRLEIFGGYLLYAVETERDGRRMYGVRLGFYVDALSAGLVARYVRPRFNDAAVVPVSDREHAQASNAAIGPATLRTGRRSGSGVCWPESAIPVDFVPGGHGRISAALHR